MFTTLERESCAREESGKHYAILCNDVTIQAITIDERPIIEVDIKVDFEREPHRSRTCNLLIKRDKPFMPLDYNSYSLVSDIMKYSLDLCLTFYLLMLSIGKFVGKMLAKVLMLIRSGTH